MLRRVPLGIIMGGYIAGVILLSGKKSGAHINPSVTWTFYRLGKINLADALLYTIAQFIGAIATSQLLKHTLGEYFGHPLINYGMTLPKPSYGSTTAFIAEFIISFIMMLVILIAIASKRYEKYVALISGVLIALYLIFELPFSGMSLNPARSTGSSLAANEYKYLWIYFVAPTLAMVAAAEIFLVIKNGRFSFKYKIDDQEIPTYPIIK